MTSKRKPISNLRADTAPRPEPNDRSAFELRQDGPLDRAFMKLSEHAFGEWKSPENERAFQDL
jgi:hypothetical protein